MVHIFEITITKSVTKQVQQYEPVKVEITMKGQLSEDDNDIEVTGYMMERVDRAVAQGFGEPVGKTETKVEEASAEPKKRKRRTKAEIEAKKTAEAETTETAESDDNTDPLAGLSEEEIVDIPENISDKQLLDEAKNAAPVIKPEGVKKIMAQFKVRADNVPEDEWPSVVRLSEMQLEDRPKYVALLRKAVAAAKE